MKERRMVGKKKKQGRVGREGSIEAGEERERGRKKKIIEKKGEGEKFQRLYIHRATCPIHTGTL